MSRAAWDLQCRATAHTAFCGHPGFVPDDYLQHLDGLHLETTITAAELCTSGMWERVGGRYRVLDWEAVEACLDQVRQARGEDPQALAWEREREAQVRARMTRPMVVTPPCAVCGTPSVPSSWWGPEAPACRVGAVARHCAGQHRPAARAGTVVSICCSGASLPAMATATPSTPPGPDGSPGRSRLPCASPGSTRPGSTTMRDSARPAMLLTAPGTGTSPALGTGTAARARQEPGPALVAVTSRFPEAPEAAQGALYGFL
jgi:hypothetical protein